MVSMKINQYYIIHWILTLAQLNENDQVSGTFLGYLYFLVVFSNTAQENV